MLYESNVFGWDLSRDLKTNDLDGEPLRFKDGKWLQGFDKAFVEDGTVMRFAPTSIQDGFVKWDDGKPVEWRLREWTSTQGAILREDLGDDDESQWENEKDPWAFTLIAARGSLTAEEYRWKLIREWLD